MIVHDSYMIILRSYLDHVHVILYHAHESRMIAARARVPSTCMIWQVVPSTGTCKSINLDLARAARYQYFTENRPAHADQNSDHKTPSSRQSSCRSCCYGVWPGWERRRRAGLLVADRPHTGTHRHATHTFTLTHSLHTTSSSRFIHTLPLLL